MSPSEGLRRGGMGAGGVPKPHRYQRKPFWIGLLTPTGGKRLMRFDRQETNVDSRFEDKAYRRNNEHIKRGKRTKRRTANGPSAANAPGGVRQRRNKRWAW
jgi:hypothetical protein